MSVRALTVALLLSICSLRVMGLEQVEETAADLEMKATPPTPLTIEGLNWNQDVNTTLQLCIKEEFPDGLAKLVFGETGGASTVEENEADRKEKCYSFTMEWSFTLPETSTLYQLFVIEDGAPTGKGSVTFAMTAKTSILTCGSSSITKLSWAAADPISYTGPCIKTDTTGDFTTDCYIDGSLSYTNFCFTVNSGAINVCLNGPIDEVPSDESFAVKSLVYGNQEVMSLESDVLDMTNMRAIVRLADDAPTVYECPDGICVLPAAIKPTYETFEVCGELRDATSGDPVQIGAAKIIDLNLNGFSGDPSSTSLLEFVFANGLDSMLYTAEMFITVPPADLTMPDDTVAVDCKGVSPGHACFGFFKITDPGEYSIALSDQTDKSNMIIASTTITGPSQVVDQFSDTF